MSRCGVGVPLTESTRAARQPSVELNRARSFVHELIRTHREASRISHPDLAVDVPTSREDISALARRLQADSREQVRMFDRPPYLDRPGVNLDVRVERERRGVRHRVIHDLPGDADPDRAGRPPGATPDADPEAETRKLLRFLAAGLSDAAIARSLEWSERTTQRRIQRLMHTLGATSRFHASLLAARRGWL